MRHIDQTIEPLLGPDKVQTSSLSLDRDGLSIRLSIVCREAEAADAIYARLEEALAGPAFRVADVNFPRP